MDEIIEISTAIESDKTIHEFRLRPNATVYISLPKDLTNNEATKIINYVRASVESKK